MRITGTPSTPNLCGAQSSATGGGSGHPASADSYEKAAGGAAVFAVFAQGAPASPLKDFGKAPVVNTEADWPAYHAALGPRIEGSGRERLLLGGGNPWLAAGDRDERIAVGWAMQTNPHVEYDADRKTFFVEGQDGSRRDVALLDEVMGTIRRNGGVSQSSGTAMQAVGALLSQKVGEAQSSGAGEGVVAVAVATAEEGGQGAGGAGKAASSGFFVALFDGMRGLFAGLFGFGSADQAQGR